MCLKTSLLIVELLNLKLDLNNPPRKEALEELLNGLKEKFNSLPQNSPMWKTILTIAPDCWTVHDIAHEFGCSYRMAAQSMNLVKSSGVLATPPFKKGTNLDDEVV